MSNDDPAGLEAGDTTDGEQSENTSDEQAGEQGDTERRAQWEGFEFRVPAAGRVRVENVSYGEDSDDHVYVVEVAEHVGATSCTCPHREYRSERCKHMAAVENQPAVMQAATTGLDGAFPDPEDDRDDAADEERTTVERAPIMTDGGREIDAESCDRRRARQRARQRRQERVKGDEDTEEGTADDDELCPLTERQRDVRRREQRALERLEKDLERLWGLSERAAARFENWPAKTQP
jgi:hypothetical protein